MLDDPFRVEDSDVSNMVTVKPLSTTCQGYQWFVEKGLQCAKDVSQQQVQCWAIPFKPVCDRCASLLPRARVLVNTTPKI